MAAITKNRKFLNGQNCSILSQKVPKFELYKHNDKPFNIYYGEDHPRIISAKFG
jgi:hypothetical protein